MCVVYVCGCALARHFPIAADPPFLPPPRANKERKGAGFARVQADDGIAFEHNDDLPKPNLWRGTLIWEAIPGRGAGKGRIG